MDEQTYVVVGRPRGGWRDWLRAYRVIVDGQDHGAIRRGETIRFAIPAGHHWIQARIDWTGSPALEFDGASGAEMVFRVEPGGSAFQWHQAFTSNAYLRLTPASEAISGSYPGDQQFRPIKR